MGFQARKVGDKSLYKGDVTDSNVYTLVIGENGCGKTRLLIDIYNYYLMSYSEVIDSNKPAVFTALHNYRLYGYAWRNVEQAYGHAIPHKLICASTSQFEKFSPNKRLKKDFKDNGFYAYIGSKPFTPEHSPATRMASTAIKQLLMMGALDDRKLRSITSFLKEFGFANNLLLTLSPTIPAADVIKLLNSETPEIETQLLMKKALEDYELSELLILLQELQSFFNAEPLLLRLNKEGVSLSDTTKPNYREVDKRMISILLWTGFITVKNIETVQQLDTESNVITDNSKIVALERRSSGEQCLFLLFLGMISAIEDNSLVLIDEPEISLHPRWQQKFVHILHGAFNEYNGCHFIIATHSPLILSDIGSLNCEILDMSSGKLFDASEHSSKSSDYQLAEVFHNPGQNNEYLITQAIELLDAICKQNIISQDIIDRAKHLQAHQLLLNPNDKASILISILSETMEKIKG